MGKFSGPGREKLPSFVKNRSMDEDIQKSPRPEVRTHIDGKE